MEIDYPTYPILKWILEKLRVKMRIGLLVDEYDFVLEIGMTILRNTC
jgi:hypothetical protein